MHSETSHSVRAGGGGTGQHKCGRTEGRKDGRKDGRTEGRKEGRKDGRTEGRKEGGNGAGPDGEHRGDDCDGGDAAMRAMPAAELGQRYVRSVGEWGGGRSALCSRGRTVPTPGARRHAVLPAAR